MSEMGLLGWILFPWMLGLLALGISGLVVGDSYWAFAFVVPAVAGGYAVSFSAVAR